MVSDLYIMIAHHFYVLYGFQESEPSAKPGKIFFY